MPETGFHLLDIATIGSGFIAFLAQFGVLIWRISKAEATIHDRISEVEHTADLEIQRLRQELIESKLDFNNKYTNKDDFKAFLTKLDARLVRLEDKIDALINRYVWQQDKKESAR